MMSDAPASKILNPAEEFAFSTTVRQLFADLAHAGELAASSSVKRAMVGSREQGAAAMFTMDIHHARIAEVRYRAYGDPYFLAGCERMARDLTDCSLLAAAQWQARELEQTLSAPASTRRWWLLLDDLLRQILAATDERVLPLPIQ